MIIGSVGFLSPDFSLAPAIALAWTSVWKPVVWMFVLPITAVSAAQFGNFTYTDNGSNITITNCLGTAGGAVAVPSSIYGKPVVEIGSKAFYNCYGITSLVIPNSVTNIRSQAFGYCTALTSITLPTSVSRIEQSMFFRCSALQSLTIPAGVTSIESGAFVACFKLQTINLPSSLTSLGGSAFWDCYALKNVAIPAPVTSIGSSTFSGCESLTSVSIPTGVTSIGDQAFSGCKSLSTISLPASLATLGESAFYRTGLKTISVASGNANFAIFDGVLFDKSRTILLRYPPKKTSSSYSVPDGVTRIATEALEGCQYLTTVSLPASCMDLGAGAFRSSPLLTNVNLPNGVTAIMDYTFSKCQSLGDLTLPSGVVSIGNWAFEESGLTGIEIPEGLNAIGLDSFINCKKLARLSVHPDNATFASDDGALFNKAGTVLKQYALGRPGSYRVPSGVTTIGDVAFFGAGSLTNVVFPSSLNTIGHSAFGACDALDRVTIPANVVLINSSAFYSCGSLTQVIFTGDAPTLGESAFSYAHPDFTIRYYNNRSGFSSPTWNGYPAVNLGDWIDLPQELVLEDSSGLELANGGIMDVGGVSSGQLGSATLTIRNAGTSDLSGLAISVDGIHAGDFEVAGVDTDYLVGGDSDSIQITFTPKALGPRSATLQISSNDGDESPFVLTLQGTGTAPEIDIEQPTGQPLADGGSRSFAPTMVGKTSELAFTIKNSGTAELANRAFSLIGADWEDFAVIGVPNVPVPAGGQAAFAVVFSPTAGGTRSAVLRLASNDANENPYDIHLTGKATVAPDIAVEQPVRSGMTDGKAKKSFGTAKVGAKGAVKTFTIRNTGSATLKDIKVTIRGRHARDFVLTPPERQGLVPGATTTFKVAFKPTASSTRSAAIRITSNDADESSFDIKLTGMGAAD